MTTLCRVLFLFLAIHVSSAWATVDHGISVFGDPRYPADFTHFSYVNPDAPKGGSIVLAEMGSWDSYNPFHPKSEAPSQIGLTFATLLSQAEDEPASAYAYVAKRIVWGKDRGAIQFVIDPRARFHDGTSVTANDVVATFKYLTRDAQPFYAAYYADVSEAVAVSNDTVEFRFKHNLNRELGLILGQLPVLKAEEADGAAKRPPLSAFTGSGPYRVGNAKPGSFVEFERVPDIWSATLPVMRGPFNYDRVRVDFYRDENVVLEALKSGQIDVHLESSAKRWATAYTGERIDKGELLRTEIPHQNPAGMQGFGMNTRRAVFADPQVRRALALMLDFEWTNSHLFHHAYTRTDSFFENSECASQGLPNAEEIALLAPFRAQLPDDVFTKVYTVPVTRGDGNIRSQLREASGLLDEAGWKISEGKRVSASGQVLAFELLLITKDFERVALPYRANLAKLGIDMRIRVVDISQYMKQLRQFDFDMIVMGVPQSASPGNEQRDYWHSSLAAVEGSRNLTGLKNPAVDALIDTLIRSNTRDAQLNACRALDRVLLWQHLVVPQWHIPHHRVAHSRRIMMPKAPPLFSDVGIFHWWIEQDR